MGILLRGVIDGLFKASQYFDAGEAGALGAYFPELLGCLLATPSGAVIAVAAKGDLGRRLRRHIEDNLNRTDLTSARLARGRHFPEPALSAVRGERRCRPLYPPAPAAPLAPGPDRSPSRRSQDRRHRLRCRLFRRGAFQPPVPAGLWTIASGGADGGVGQAQPGCGRQFSWLRHVFCRVAAHPRGSVIRRLSIGTAVQVFGTPVQGHSAPHRYYRPQRSHCYCNEIL